jgi:molybdate transport system substrate-binding protein
MTRSMETAAREIHVFSPSAMHSSLEALAQAHRNATRDIVTLAFEIAPAFRKRLEEGQQADVVIAPPAVMDELVEIGKARADGRFELGRVGVGIVVRGGAPIPDVSSRAALERALLDAESVVYNYASSGTYVQKLIERLGLGEALAHKTTRLRDAQESFTHLLQGKGREIGFGGVTEIGRWRDRGLVLVGPLPPEIQNFTSYIATLASDAINPDGAKSFLAFLRSPEAKAIMTAHGVQ